jgi:hypothetical protein
MGNAYFVAGRRTILGLTAAFAFQPMQRAVADVPPSTRRILVVGDSQAQGLAAGLHRGARHGNWGRILDDAKPGTGLVSLAAYDWPASLPALLKTTQPDLAMLMFGANDGMPLRLETGKAVLFGNDAWKAAYRARATAIAQAVRQSGAKLVWVGNPIARDAEYSRNMQLINAIFADVTRAQGGSFVDIWLTVSDGAGNFAGYGANLAGVTERLRLDDGIHFTPAGYDILAAHVMRSVETTHLASIQK